MKKTFYTELAYLFGILILALGTACMEHADFGVSMVVAPAYLLHLKISEYVPFFSFGMAEYTLQAVLVIAVALIQRKFKKSYLFSAVTAVFYGVVLDGFMVMTTRLPADMFALRVVYFIIGMFMCSIGVSMLFHTHISPEAYELFVKEISAKVHMDISRFKTIYDCTSCVIAVVMSFLFFGLWQFKGVNVGTVICSLLNGWLIGRVTVFSEKRFEFKDGLPFRKYFEG